MKLRLAKKIWNALGTPREAVYNYQQKDRAVRRMERTKGCRENREFWDVLMAVLGPRGRAEVIKDNCPAGFFKIMMDTPDEEFKYGSRKDKARLDELIQEDLKKL